MADRELIALNEGPPQLVAPTSSDNAVLVCGSLKLPSGFVFNFDSLNVAITHSPGALSFGSANIDINGGTIDNTVIGGTTPAAVSGTTIAGTSTTDATSTTAAAMKTAGGLGVVKKIYVGDNIILATAGKGVDFSANGGGVLDQYQETTFTPVLSDGTNDATASVAVGNAIKIGEFVFASVYLVLSSKGSISGALRITGLPFTTDNLANSWNGGRAYASNLNITAGQSVGFASPPNVTYINLYLSDSTSGDTALQDTEVTDTTVIRLSFSYRAIS